MTSPPSESKSLLRSAGVVGFMTLVSRLTGMLQSRMLAAYLGASGSPAADAFFVALRIPNLLRRFAAEGTMTSAFVPTLNESEAEGGEAALRDMVAKFLGTLGLLMLLVCTVGVLAMGLVTGLMCMGRLAPGGSLTAQFVALGQALTGHRALPEDLILARALGRIMFPYLGLVSLTAGLSAVLNQKDRFGLAASVSTFWNLAFMAFAGVWFQVSHATARDPRRASFVFALAVLVGGIAQLAILWPAFRRMGHRLDWGLHLGHPGVRRVLKRMGPGILGTGIAPINVMISTILASQLPQGAQTVLFQSNMMSEMVLGLFSASIATVSLPAMSRLVQAEDWDGLRSSLGTALRGTAFLVIPGAVGLAVLAQPIIALLFRTGRFSAFDVQWTAETLAFQCVGLLFISAGRIVAQCLYAQKDYHTPAYAGLGSIAVNLALSWVLMRHLGTSGIALANGLAGLANLLMMLPVLSRRLDHQLPTRSVLGGWGLMLLASLPLALAAWSGAHLLHLEVFRGLAPHGLRLLPLVAGAGFSYFLAAYLLGIPESRQLWQLVARKLRLPVGH